MMITCKVTIEVASDDDGAMPVTTYAVEDYAMFGDNEPGDIPTYQWAPTVADLTEFVNNTAEQALMPARLSVRT